MKARCSLNSCTKTLSRMAVLYGDPYCSRECAETAYGTREQNQLSLKDPYESDRIPAYRGPATDAYAAHLKRWANRRRAS